MKAAPDVLAEAYCWLNGEALGREDREADLVAQLAEELQGARLRADLFRDAWTAAADRCNRQLLFLKARRAALDALEADRLRLAADKGRWRRRCWRWRAAAMLLAIGALADLLWRLLWNG